LENADSARRCRFRNSQQKRASDLDPTYVWIPKLDVAGSNPDPDLVKQFAPRRIRREFLRSERPKTALSKRALFDRRVRRGFRKLACSNMRPYSHLNATTGSALHPPKRAGGLGTALEADAYFSKNRPPCYSSSGGTLASAANCMGVSAGEGRGIRSLTSVGIADDLHLDGQRNPPHPPLGGGLQNAYCFAASRNAAILSLRRHELTRHAPCSAWTKILAINRGHPGCEPFSLLASSSRHNGDEHQLRPWPLTARASRAGGNSIPDLQGR
jgi:hypothetical protein